MSILFTRSAFSTSPAAPLPALLQTAGEWVIQGVQARLAAAGQTPLSAPQLMVFAHLECGASHASAVAQRMGLTRQAVYRTLRELQGLDLVVLVDDDMRGNQKVIRLTANGETLALAGRAALAEMEAQLAERIGEKQMRALRQALEADWGGAA